MGSALRKQLSSKRLQTNIVGSARTEGGVKLTALRTGDFRAGEGSDRGGGREEPRRGPENQETSGTDKRHFLTGGAELCSESLRKEANHPL